MPGPIQLTVSGAEAGQKLVQYLGRVLGKDMPGSVFMRWIRTGQVRLDGKRTKPFDRVAEGQIVRLPPFAELPPERAARAQASPAVAPARTDETDIPDRAGKPGQRLGAETRPSSAGASVSARDALVSGGQDEAGHGGLKVLAETEDWLVLSKPAGLPVHPGSGWTDSVQTRLGRAYAGAPFVPVIAHRLDRDTSGVLLAARTHRALTGAHQAFKAGRAVKEYLCWVRGAWALSGLSEPIELADRMAKSGPGGREKMAVGEGKEARLAATPLRIEADRTLLKVRLFTGRTHQIRVQLSSRGHPIVGDAKYGGGKPPLYLHAWRLAIRDEAFTCPPPWTGRWAPEI